MKNKNLIIAGGVALGLGIIYFFWKKGKGDDSKKKSDLDETSEIDEFIDEDADLLPDLSQQPTTAQPSINLGNIVQNPISIGTVRPLRKDPFEGCEVYNVDRLVFRRNYDSFNGVWVYFTNRPKQTDFNRVSGTWSLVDAGNISGNYSIRDRFIDVNGNIGAVEIRINKNRYTPSSNDTSLRNIAKFVKCPSSSFEGNGNNKFECDDLLTDI